MNIYETHKMKDPRLPFIFHITDKRSESLDTICNWHENVEILYVEDGSGYITVDDERIPVKKGDISVVSANRLHGLYTEGSTMRYLCLIIDRTFFIANHFDSNDFSFEVIFKDEEIARLITRFGELWGDENSAMRVQHLRATALNIATILCERHAVIMSGERAESRMTSCIKHAIGYIRAESHRDLSLDEVSALVGISKYYFAREFRRITGYSFVGYLNVVRCEKARELLLNDDMSVREVGEACGYTNQSYFTRTFREYVGMTPLAYRKRN